MTMPSRGTVLVGKFDQVWRASFSEKSYSTLSRWVSSKVARNAFTAVTTSAVFAPPGLAPSVLRSTAVICCMPPAPPGPPLPVPPLPGSAEPQPETVRTPTASRLAVTEILVRIRTPGRCCPSRVDGVDMVDAPGLHAGVALGGTPRPTSGRASYRNVGGVGTTVAEPGESSTWSGSEPGKNQPFEAVAGAVPGVNPMTAPPPGRAVA